MAADAGVKCPDKSKLRKKWLTLAHSSVVLSIIVGKWQQKCKAASSIVSSVRKQRTRSTSIQLNFFFSTDKCYPHGVKFPTSTNPIQINPTHVCQEHNLIQKIPYWYLLGLVFQMILYAIKLTILTITVSKCKISYKVNTQ